MKRAILFSIISSFLIIISYGNPASDYQKNKVKGQKTGVVSALVTLKEQIYDRREGGFITLGNGLLEISISEADGTIRHLINKADKVDYCNQVMGASMRDPEVPLKVVSVGERIGGVQVYDDLARKTFSDLTGSTVISNIKILLTDDGTICTFDKAFNGADFVVTQSFTIKEDHLRW